MSFLIKEYVPAAALQPFVLRYWEGTYLGKPTAALELKMMPSGYIELVLHLSDARCQLKINTGWQRTDAFTMVGFHTAPFFVQFTDRVETFALRFKPEAMYFIFGIPAAQFINCSGNLEEIFGPSFTSFCLQIKTLKSVEERIQLTDQYLLKRLYQSKAQTCRVQLATQLIRRQKGEITVEALSSAVCISTRQLEREFKNKLGLTPKTYARIARLNHVLQLIDQTPIPFAQLSYSCGYADQAHFIRDFKLLTGELPSVYVQHRKAI